MSRTTIDISYKCSLQEARQKVETILTIRSYQQATYKTGETVWKSGSGVFALPKYIKVDYDPNVIHISAWVCNAFNSNELSIAKCPNLIAKNSTQKTLQELVNAFQ